MATLQMTPVTDRIKKGMDGRTNRWLKEKLADRGIILSDSQISQRLNNLIEWTGNEAIACFEILKIELQQQTA